MSTACRFLSGMSCLAQAKSAYGDVLLWGAILIVAIVVLGIGVMLLRRRLTTDEAADTSSDDWSLQTLREMRSAGQISEAEFQTLRARIISQYSAGSADAADAGDGLDSDASGPAD